MLKEFKEKLTQRYWKYQETQFSNQLNLFERPKADHGRPPVFIREESWRNVITDPNADQEEIKQLIALVPDGERHRWYGSMNSSQALAQSVLGNLAVNNLLERLSDINSDEGNELFGDVQHLSDNFSMEHKVNYLGEPRSTSLDGLISGDYQIAIECKFTEPEMGTCSRPRLKPADSNFDRDHCDGNFAIQREREKRCSLTERGVLYWRYVPQLFKWGNDIDLIPCPLNKNYQLVRNILAAGVTLNGNVSIDNGHVILIYDERNPAFQENGDGLVAYFETKDALQAPNMLRKCSWQHIVNYLRDENILPWLTEDLALKYGF